ncbi:MAG: ABC transporter permease, partial [Zoogloea sp.]|nr:ABC transporter permease [Zoogloea sp.]
MDGEAGPRIETEAAPSGAAVVRLSGDWTLAQLSPVLPSIRASLRDAPEDAEWRLDGITRLDSFGATLLWQRWGRRLPEQVSPDEVQSRMFDRLAALGDFPGPRPGRYTPGDATAQIGCALFLLWHHLADMVWLVGQLILDVLHLLPRPSGWPWREVTANLHKTGVKAMPVTALVGFLIGVVLSYLSALQLRTLGAGNYIVNILGLGIIRELGPVLVAVLVAGRSGSAMTAQLGVMRVTEEIDALATMGISRTERLVLPKVLALTLAMPLLALWTSAVALIGGAMSAWIQLDLSPAFFMQALPHAVPLANLVIGLSKSAVFGFLVALIHADIAPP